MSYVDADKFKTQEEVAMETRCIAWNIRQHFTLKKRKKTWATVAKSGFGWGKISLSFLLRQKYFHLETMKLNVMKAFTFYFGLFTLPQNKK